MAGLIGSLDSARRCTCLYTPTRALADSAHMWREVDSKPTQYCVHGWSHLLGVMSVDSTFSTNLIISWYKGTYLTDSYHVSTPSRDCARGTLAFCPGPCASSMTAGAFGIHQRYHEALRPAKGRPNVCSSGPVHLCKVWPRSRTAVVRVHDCEASLQQPSMIWHRC